MPVNPNDPAFPCQVLNEHPNERNELLEEHTGMDIRTEIATRAMAAFVSAADRMKQPNVVDREDLTRIAVNSVVMADIMIDELNKPRQ